jgi:hypothetical protein
MKGHICLAGLLTVISSVSLAGPDKREASTPASPVTSRSAPAVRTGVSAVMMRVMSGDGMLNSLWSLSRVPQCPAGIAKP